MILRESSSLPSPFLFVTLAQDSILRTLSSSCGAICFKIFQRWRDQHRLRKTFLHSPFCALGRILTMFIHSDRVELFCCFVGNYRKLGNIYLLEMALNLLLCGFRLFTFYWTRYHTDLEQMLKENRQIFVIMGTESWKLPLKQAFCLKELIIVIQKL